MTQMVSKQKSLSKKMWSSGGPKSETPQLRMPVAELHWTKKESREFRKKLQMFREGLPERQRKVFNRILAGAVEGYRFGKKASAHHKGAASSFARKLGTFRDGLPSRQRDAFTSMIAAGAVAWGAAAEGEQGDVGTIYFWHALLVPLAVITVGVVLIAEELSKGEDAEAPDLSGMPTSPEFPD